MSNKQERVWLEMHAGPQQVIANLALRTLGYHKAVVFTHMYRSVFFNNDDWTMYTNAYAMSSLELTEKQFKHVYHQLKELNLIKVKKQGTPPKRYIKINWSVYAAMASKHAKGGAAEGRGVSSSSALSPSEDSPLPLHEVVLPKRDRNGSGIVSNNTTAIPVSELTGSEANRTSASRKGFLPELDDIHHKTKASTFGTQCSQRLLDYLHKQGRALTKKVSISSWAKEFDRLRDHFTRTEVEEVLTWYTKQTIGDVGVPYAFSAKTFRMKYDQIRQNMIRTKTTTMEDVKISKEAKKIGSRLSSMYWPKGGARDLDKCVQVTMNTIVDLVAKLSDYVDAKPIKEHHKRLRPLAKNLMTRFEYVSSASEEWMIKVNKRIANWDDWHGNLLLMAATYKNKSFIRLCATYAREYSGSDTNWEELAERLELT